ncbi:MAG: flagellar biosynthesis anti-sigma factor FlgM [Gammaproteobacteria bacterium]|nr:flagellar biosynthesis anti-sigma factor FlgM [Gammaproteobacteria bacterium]
MVNNIKNGGVQNNALYQNTNQKLAQEQAKQQVGQESSTKQTAKDSVALTPQATQLKELQKRLGDTEAFDRKKVDEIKEAISSGNYSIDYDSLASKLAQFEFEL